MGISKQSNLLQSNNLKNHFLAPLNRTKPHLCGRQCGCGHSCRVAVSRSDHSNPCCQKHTNLRHPYTQQEPLIKTDKTSRHLNHISLAQILENSQTRSSYNQGRKLRPDSGQVNLSVSFLPCAQTVFQIEILKKKSHRALTRLLN